jgi:hypothetical protein
MKPVDGDFFHKRPASNSFAMGGARSTARHVVRIAVISTPRVGKTLNPCY